MAARNTEETPESIQTARRFEFTKLSGELLAAMDDNLWEIFRDEHQNIVQQLSRAQQIVKVDFELRNTPYEIAHRVKAQNPYEPRRAFVNHYLSLAHEDSQNGEPIAWTAYGVICSDYRDDITKLDETITDSLLY